MSATGDKFLGSESASVAHEPHPGALSCSPHGAYKGLVKPDAISCELTCPRQQMRSLRYRDNTVDVSKSLFQLGAIASPRRNDGVHVRSVTVRNSVAHDGPDKHIAENAIRI